MISSNSAKFKYYVNLESLLLQAGTVSVADVLMSEFTSRYMARKTCEVMVLFSRLTSLEGSSSVRA